MFTEICFLKGKELTMCCCIQPVLVGSLSAFLFHQWFGELDRGLFPLDQKFQFAFPEISSGEFISQHFSQFAEKRVRYTIFFARYTIIFGIYAPSDFSPGTIG